MNKLPDGSLIEEGVNYAKNYHSYNGILAIFVFCINTEEVRDFYDCVLKPNRSKNPRQTIPR